LWETVELVGGGVDLDSINFFRVGGILTFSSVLYYPCNNFIFIFPGWRPPLPYTVYFPDSAVQLLGMAPNTSYAIRVRGFNSLGALNFSYGSFTTLPPYKGTISFSIFISLQKLVSVLFSND
jgi:hypothetical protein